jgi:regulator of protease activity HflC (stomatin/prohibitin superfamily)
MLSKQILKRNLTRRVFSSSLTEEAKEKKEANEERLSTLDNSNKLNFGIQIVPNQEVRIVEKFGEYHRTLSPGIHFLIPFMHRVKYTHSLKERMLKVDPQTCWTKDNVQVSINGNVFVQVNDPKKTSYSVEEPYSMIYQMAFSAMRAEVGLLELDDLLNQRDHINNAITSAIRPRTEEWGISLLGYEIQDIEPQREVLHDLTKQSKAERDRREAVKASEGERQVKINHSEGQMQATINDAKALAESKIMIAEAEARSKIIIAEAEAEAIRKTGIELINSSTGGPEAANFAIARGMTDAWHNIGKEGTTILLPNNPSDISSMVATALSTYKSINTGK